MGRLDAVDLSLSLTAEEEAERLAAAQMRLLELRLQLGGQIGGELGPPLLVLFEGWDAAGKGGAIKRLVARQDPRHYRVCSFAAPSDDEKRHHFLWRFWSYTPGRGGMVVLDRSWYGRVLVERVEGFASSDEWMRSYDEINTFEALLVNQQTIIVKFFVHISDEEQLRRFERRERDRIRRWKLTDEDWRNRERRAEYVEAVEDMLRWTDRPGAPWFVVPADSKRYARVNVIETVIDQIETGMRAAGIEPATM